MECPEKDLDLLLGDWKHRDRPDGGGSRDSPKQIIDPKTFKGRVMRVNGKGGEPEMRVFAFSLRMFLSKDNWYISLMDAIELHDEEIDEEAAAVLKKATGEGGGVFSEIEHTNA